MKNLITILAVSSFVVACSEYQPIVDMKGVDQYQYQQDKAECDAYAAQVQDNTGRNALIGVALGAALGAATGGNRNTVGTGAAIGGIAGGGTGKAKQLSEREQVLNNCLYNRGYNILNATGGNLRYKAVDRYPN